MGGQEKRTENTIQTANRRDKHSVFHFSAPVDRRNNPAKTCLLNTSLSLLSGFSLNGSKSRATADWGAGGGALRLLSDTANDCYENAFMSVRSSSAVFHIDVTHSLPTP